MPHQKHVCKCKQRFCGLFTIYVTLPLFGWVHEAKQPRQSRAQEFRCIVTPLGDLAIDSRIWGAFERSSLSPQIYSSLSPLGNSFYAWTRPLSYFTTNFHNSPRIIGKNALRGLITWLDFVEIRDFSEPKILTCQRQVPQVNLLSCTHQQQYE